VQKSNGGTAKELQSKVWIKSPERREYKGMCFLLVRSVLVTTTFIVVWLLKPREGDWSLMRNHIKEVIASDNTDLYKWIMGWLADLVQNPGGDLPGTSICLRGNKV